MFYLCFELNQNYILLRNFNLLYIIKNIAFQFCLPFRDIKIWNKRQNTDYKIF